MGSSYKKGDRVLVVIHDGPLAFTYINEIFEDSLRGTISILGGTVIDLVTEHLNPYDEHDQGTVVYTVICDDGKVYTGTTFRKRYNHNCIITDKASLEEKHAAYIKFEEEEINLLEAKIKKIRSKINSLKEDEEFIKNMDVTVPVKRRIRINRTNGQEIKES